ncbi:MAG: hypothetical protein R2771_02550 [Saprospiraceae bacterium]
MIKNFLTFITFFILLNCGYSQIGSFRIRSDDFIQIGYDTYKSLTFGQTNSSSGPNNGGIGIEYWNNGFNIFSPWPNINYGNYLLFIRHDNFNTGIGKYPSSTYKLDVNGKILATGYYTSSDSKLKRTSNHLFQGWI